MKKPPFVATDAESGLLLATRLPGAERLSWDRLVVIRMWVEPQPRGHAASVPVPDDRGLARDRPGVVAERDAAELRIAGEQVARVVDALEELRDRAAVTQDEIRARQDVRLNRTVYLLTIVATIALPLSLLTGLLGINVGGIPLAGSPWGFAAVCALMAVVAAAEVALFKAMRWL
ncbi:MAG: CorA family divalent cation transporter [Planctomycetota bacterium]